MFDAAFKALIQMFSPPFRSVLIKSMLLAVVTIVLLGVGLYKFLDWLTVSGGLWAEGALGPNSHAPLSWIIWFASIASALGIVVGGIFLMPAVTAFVGSFFVDEIAEIVERTYYPADPIGTALPLGRSVLEGTKTALIALLIYLIALPFILFAGLGFLILFLAAAWLLSREYFELAAMRFRPPAEAKALRKAHQATIFTAGLLIAAFVSIPIVNLATPLFGMAMMVHLHKRLSGRRPSEIGSARAEAIPGHRSGTRAPAP
ncbi:MAG: sulfate transporter family protein [Pseudorhodoplanes sp.]|uniref:sulfate transporter family protein n=1 Tax=Pseudorhodoplanes sp. TaxID=1934341 RepID=UPI003D0D901E